MQNSSKINIATFAITKKLFLTFSEKGFDLQI